MFDLYDVLRYDPFTFFLLQASFLRLHDQTAPSHVVASVAVLHLCHVHSVCHVDLISYGSR